MASIRKLKKDINYLAYELLTEAFTYKHFHTDLKEKKFDEVIKKIILQRSELIIRVNQANELNGSSKKTEHFRKIKEDMVKMVELMHSLND